MAFVSMNLQGRPAVVVGGGAVAERRTETLLLEGARVAVIAPTVTERLSDWAQAGQLVWRAEVYSFAVLMDVLMHELTHTSLTGQVPRLVSLPLVFVATDQEALNEQVTVDAHRLGGLVNRADNAQAGDFTMPNHVRLMSTSNLSQEEGTGCVVPFRQERQSPMPKTILTIGIEMLPAHPRLSRLLREDMETRYRQVGEALADLVLFRRQVRELLPTSQARTRFWRDHLGRTEFSLIREGHWNTVKETLENAISALRLKP